MAQITISVDDAKLERIQGALCGLYGLQPDETPLQLLKRVTKAWWRGETRRYEEQVETEAARAKVTDLDI
jgi:hypothetical protein